MKTLTALFPEGGKNGHLGAHDCLLYEPMFYPGRLTLWPWRKTKRKHFKRDKRAQSRRLWVLRTDFALEVIFLGEDSDAAPRALSWGSFEQVCRSVADSHHQQRLCHHCTRITAITGQEPECVPSPHAWPFWSSLPAQSRNVPSSLMTLVHVPIRTKTVCKSLCNPFCCIHCSPALPPRVCMQIRPKLTPFLNSASLAWGNISFMMAQNQLQSFASSSTDLTFFSVCKKEKRTCSSSYMLLL